MIRSYIELDMFSSLSVQTESTLNAGYSEILLFETLLQVCCINIVEAFNLNEMAGLFSKFSCTPSQIVLCCQSAHPYSYVPGHSA